MRWRYAGLVTNAYSPAVMHYAYARPRRLASRCTIDWQYTLFAQHDALRHALQRDGLEACSAGGPVLMPL